jgi:hypothetical protein
MLTVWTARVSYAGPDRLDVTRAAVESAVRDDAPVPEGAVFAPSRAILDPAKRAERYAEAHRNRGQHADAQRIEDQAWAIYEPLYVAEMRASYRAHRAAWDALLACDEKTLCCFCSIAPERPRCHRILLAGILAKLGARCAGERGAGVQLELGRPGREDRTGILESEVRHGRR